MDIDVPSLLAPVSEDAPAGPELPYDPQRLLIEQAFDRPFSIAANAKPGSSESQKGEDWREIVEAIVELFGRTKDIWLAIFLARAGARWGRLDVIESGVVALGGLFDLYWPTLHPSIDDGLPARARPCASLNNRTEFQAPVERLIVVSHQRFGNFTAADLTRFHANGESEPNYGFFRNALNDLGPEPLRETDARLERIILAFGKVEALFSEKGGDEAASAAPSFKGTVTLLAGMRTAIRLFLPTEAADAEDTPGDMTPESPGLEPAGATSPNRMLSAPGTLASRDDVLKAIDAITGYYRKNEPSSPVPVALERIRAWVTMPFMDVLMDIAPNSREDLERVLLLTKSRDGA